MRIHRILEQNEGNHATKGNPLLVSKDNVGIEIELEGVNRDLYRNKRRTYWSAVKDGSLRNDGVEFIFKSPLGGDNVIKALDELVGIVKAFPNVVVNDRTGMHCHVDVRDLSPRQLKTFLLLAVMFEEVLINKTGSRNDNIFCCKFSTSDAQLKFVSNIGYLTTRNKYDTFEEVHKYASVNCRAIIEKGSLEFRYHRGTYDKAEILLWINTLLSMKLFSRNNSIDPDELTRIFSAGGGTQLFERVLGAEIAANYCDENTEELLVQGMRLAQDACLLGKLVKEQDVILYGMNKEGFHNKLCEGFTPSKKKKKPNGDELFVGGVRGRGINPLLEIPMGERVAPAPIPAGDDLDGRIRRYKQERQRARDGDNPDQGLIGAYDNEIRRLQNELRAQRDQQANNINNDFGL